MRNKKNQYMEELKYILDCIINFDNEEVLEKKCEFFDLVQKSLRELVEDFNSNDFSDDKIDCAADDAYPQLV